MSDDRSEFETVADDRTRRREPAAAVTETLRELGLQFVDRAGTGEVPPGDAPFAGPVLGAGVRDGAESALFAGLGIDAVITTNLAVSQPSLHEFLR